MPVDPVNPNSTNNSPGVINPPSGLVLYEGKGEEDLVSEDIDERILKLLELDDVFDIDYGTYNSLLKERLIASRNFNKKLSAEEDQILVEEFKRVRGKVGRFKLKKKKITASTFIRNTSVGKYKRDDDEEESNDKQQSKALPGKGGALAVSQKSSLVNAQKFKPDIEYVKVKEIQESLLDILKSIKKTVDSIYNILLDQSKILKKNSEENRKRREDEARKKKESGLEGVKNKPDFGGIAKKVLEPAQGIFERLFNFLFYTFLGRMWTKFMNWAADPENRKKLESVGRFIKDWWPALLAAWFFFVNPLGRFIRNVIGTVLKLTFRLAKFAIPKIKDFIKGRRGGGPGPRGPRGGTPRGPTPRGGGKGGGLLRAAGNVLKNPLVWFPTAMVAGAAAGNEVTGQREAAPVQADNKAKVQTGRTTEVRGTDTGIDKSPSVGDMGPTTPHGLLQGVATGGVINNYTTNNTSVYNTGGEVKNVFSGIVDRFTGTRVSGAGKDTQKLSTVDPKGNKVGNTVLQVGEVVLQPGVREKIIADAGVDPLSYNSGPNANKPKLISSDNLRSASTGGTVGLAGGGAVGSFGGSAWDIAKQYSSMFGGFKMTEDAPDPEGSGGGGGAAPGAPDGSGDTPAGGGGGGGSTDTSLSPNRRAMLDAIARAEGTDKYPNSGYNTMFTGKQFSGYKSHPRQIQRSGRYSSDAAGRYQFLSTTWDGLGLPDFSPINQDKGAVKLLQRRNALGHVDAGKWEDAFRASNKEWASFPGSPYGQPTKSMNSLVSYVKQRMTHYQSGGGGSNDADVAQTTPSGPGKGVSLYAGHADMTEQASGGKGTDGGIVRGDNALGLPGLVAAAKGKYFTNEAYFNDMIAKKAANKANAHYRQPIPTTASDGAGSNWTRADKDSNQNITAIEIHQDAPTSYGGMAGLMAQNINARAKSNPYIKALSKSYGIHKAQKSLGFTNTPKPNSALLEVGPLDSDILKKPSGYIETNSSKIANSLKTVKAAAGGLIAFAGGGLVALQGGGQPKPQPAPSGGYFYGDSIAVGYGKNAPGLRRVGANPAEILGYIQRDLKKNPEIFKGKTVNLSTGVSNNTSDFMSIEQQIKLLKQGGANVVVLGAAQGKYDKENQKLSALTSRYGVTFRGGFKPGSDGIHPANYSVYDTGGQASQTKPGSQDRPTGGGGGAADNVMNFLISNGLTKDQAAGIAGNLQQESGFRPTASNGSHYGIAQWDNQHRWPRVSAYIRSQGKNPETLEGQLIGLKWEAEQRGDWARIKKESSATGAAASWLKNFERSGEKPGQAGYENRMKYAAKLAGGSYSGTFSGDTALGGASTPEKGEGGTAVAGGTGQQPGSFTGSAWDIAKQYANLFGGFKMSEGASEPTGSSQTPGQEGQDSSSPSTTPSDETTLGSGKPAANASEGSKTAGELGRYVKSKLKQGPDFSQVHRHPEHPPYSLSSGHSSGSYHYKGRAVDIGAYTKEQAPILKVISDFNKEKGVRPVELLHGKNEPSNHWHHVHVAYKGGGKVGKPKIGKAKGGKLTNKPKMNAGEKALASLIKIDTISSPGDRTMLGTDWDEVDAMVEERQRGSRNFISGAKTGGSIMPVGESTGANVLGATADRQKVSVQPGSFILTKRTMQKLGHKSTASNAYGGGELKNNDKSSNPNHPRSNFKKGAEPTIPALLQPGEGIVTPEKVSQMGGPNALASLNEKHDPSATNKPRMTKAQSGGFISAATGGLIGGGSLTSLFDQNKDSFEKQPSSQNFAPLSLGDPTAKNNIPPPPQVDTKPSVTNLPPISQGGPQSSAAPSGGSGVPPFKLIPDGAMPVRTTILDIYGIVR